MTKRENEILTQAIERNSAAVSSLPSAGMFRYYGTRFLRGIDQRVWIEGVVAERPLIESMVTSAIPAVVSFKAGGQRVTFSSPILEIDHNYRFFDAKTAVQAVLMNRPGQVKAEQRRNHYRVPVRYTDQFSVQLWRISDHADLKAEPTTLCQLFATVRDLSVGGVGVVFATQPKLVPETRLRILLRHGDAPEMLIDGRSGPLRQIQGTESFETGIQFRDLQNSLAGRQTLTDLTRMVSVLQMQEARRVRGGKSER